MILTLPIPSSELATNKSKGHHWSTRVKARTKARQDGYYLALQYATLNFTTYKNTYNSVAIKGGWELKIRVFYKNEKHLDDDNLLSALKSFRDGVFDFLKQKVNMDDKQITLTILDTSGRDKLNPRIEWKLEPRV